MPASKTKAAEQPAQRTRGRVEYREFLPGELTVDPFNHRQGKMAPPSPELKASIALKGVQEVVGVRPQPDGTFGVFKGRRRLLAAQEHAAKAAGKGDVFPVPALIYWDLAEVDDDTLLLSLLENQFRENATKADELQVAQQLALMDIPETKRRQHAKVLGVPMAQLNAAKGAAQLGAEAVSSALAEDFDWIEMDEWRRVGGDRETFRRLSLAKARDQRSGKRDRKEWRQTLEAIRAEQALRARVQAAEDELRAAGVTVAEHQYRWTYGTTRPLAHLLTSLGKPMTLEIHAQICPSHAAYVDPDSFEPVYVCTDWHSEGHQLIAEEAAELDRLGRTPVDPEAEKAKDKAKREGNAAWRTAREVRLPLLTEAVAAKTLPDAADELVEAAVMGAATWWVKAVASRKTAITARLLGVADPNEGRSQWERAEDPFRELIARGPKSRRRHRQFARVAAAIEQVVMADGAWQEPTAELVWWLNLLEKEFGHTPQEIEAQALAEWRRKQQTSAEACAERDQAAAEPDENGQDGTPEEVSDADSAQPVEPAAPHAEESSTLADPEPTEASSEDTEQPQG